MKFFLGILFIIQGVTALHGGINADAKSSEFIVSIWYLHQHKCTGSILDRSHILTAGHCVKGLPAVSLSVSVGDSTLVLEDIELLPVTAIYLHPGYRELPCSANASQCNLVNNIAIIELATELIWGEHLAAIQLFDRVYALHQCEPCTVFGWNRDSMAYLTLLRLRWTLVLVICKNQCQSVMDLMKSENIVMNIFSPDEFDNEDYGSPIICSGNAVGILIDGGQYHHHHPVILSIYPHLEFIARTLKLYEYNIHDNLPHYAAIFINGEYWCGGSIIKNTHILTAGHCVENTAVETLGVIVGRSRFYKESLLPSDFVLVDRIQMHPNYVHERYPNLGVDNFKNDIAVLRLRTPLTLSNSVSSVGLSEITPFGKKCRLYRWSRIISASGQTLLKSSWSTVFIHSPHTCRSYNDRLEPTAFCVWSMYSLPIAMIGDSGSPIVCNGFYAVGVLSSSTQTKRLWFGPMQLMYYTSVYSNYQFIMDSIAD